MMPAPPADSPYLIIPSGTAKWTEVNEALFKLVKSVMPAEVRVVDDPAQYYVARWVGDILASHPQAARRLRDDGQSMESVQEHGGRLVDLVRRGLADETERKALVMEALLHKETLRGEW